MTCPSSDPVPTDTAPSSGHAWSDPNGWGGPDDTDDPDERYEQSRDWSDPDVF